MLILFNSIYESNAYLFFYLTFQGSLKSQINNRMVSGSSEPMIKEECATYRPACDF